MKKKLYKKHMENNKYWLQLKSGGKQTRCQILICNHQFVTCRKQMMIYGTYCSQMCG